MIDPILIMATPRSGSSMTAGIFAEHGVWTGDCPARHQPRNPRGTFENIAIRDIIREHNGKLVKSGEVSDRIPGFREKVEKAMLAQGYKGGPWLWKGSCIYWPAWYEWDACKFVVVRRDIEATIRSINRPPYALPTHDQAKLRKIIELHHQQLDVLLEMGAFEVDTNAVTQGDFSSIKAAIEGCGLTFNQEITNEFVIPGQFTKTA